MFFNDTKVIPARILLQRKTGALIEIFLLEPLQPSKEMAQAMTATKSCIWKCLVGNLKKWKDDEILDCTITRHSRKVRISAILVSRLEMQVQFLWDDPEITFSELLEELGKLPLPPYMDRETESEDINRYQTIYSRSQGAVAAPTAGLHFTDKVMNGLSVKGIKKDFLTLHVSAGTFQPIKVKDVARHPMHSEQILVSRKNIESMLESEFSIAVGTTSMRTLESIYWYGVHLEVTGNLDFHIKKDAPYTNRISLPLNKSLENVLSVMDKREIEQMYGTTEVFILPGYEFKCCDGLITNFHMPGSTLMLLVAAFVGHEWKNVYVEALKNKYRFLSYGDSSILLR